MRFLGAVGARQLAQAYRMADLFVTPPAGEGFGIAFLEAMASGTLALGLDVGGARDALADGELAILVSEEDLPGALDPALRVPRSDPQALAGEVHAHVGRRAFATQLRATLSRHLSG